MSSPKEISRRQFVTGIMAAGAAAACLPKSVSALLEPAGALAMQQQRRRPFRPAVELRATPFPMNQVRLLPGPFLDALETNHRYLLSLPVDSLLHNFRVTAGLASSAKPLGGWEAPACELRGHFAGGHFLSGCALLYSSTGDDKIKAKGEEMVAELAKCQKAIGNGYLSAFPEAFFDRLSDGQPVWAPFYTLHKIMAGHIDMYTHCQSQQALENAEGMARWIGHWLIGISDDHMQRILKTEYGGMNEALFNLAAATGNYGYMGTARQFQQPSFFDPLSQHRDELKGLHANTNIPKVIGAARGYELTGDPYYHEVAGYFWREVTTERCYATGGTSNAEHWRTDPGNLSTELSSTSEECCCGYNMLKLTRHLHQWTADPRYMDYYERTLFNSRLGTQHPRNGLKMYYLPLETGYWKYFNSPLNSFWCCTGTGAEEFSKFNDSIYSHDDHGVFVNLFIASQVQWPEKGLTIAQNTRFPDQEGTALVVKASQPVETSIRVRIPDWAQGGSAELNGQRLTEWASPGSYLEINRTWKEGDRLDVKLPMRLHTRPLLGEQTRRAAMYGPIVLAARLGAEGVTPQTQYDANSGPTEVVLRGKPQGAANISLKPGADIESADWIRPVKGEPLTFATVGQPKPTTLVPLHRIFSERYGVYWKVHQA